MSTKKQLSEAEIKAAEELEKNRKAIQKVADETAAAKKVALEAKAALKEADKSDAKAVATAQKVFDEAKAKYNAAAEAETKARIKVAQNGSYLPEEKERGIFHVKLDKPAFSTKDGKKLSKAYIQKFTVADWNHFVKNSQGLGYTMEIMWNPVYYSL